MELPTGRGKHPRRYLLQQLPTEKFGVVVKQQHFTTIEHSNSDVIAKIASAVILFHKHHHNLDSHHITHEIIAVDYEEICGNYGLVKRIPTDQRVRTTIWMEEE